MSPQKWHISKFTLVLLASFLLDEVTGIPLPLRDNLAFGVPRHQEQAPTPNNIPYGSPEGHSRWRRHQEERPIVNQHHQDKPLPPRDQQRHTNVPNNYGHRDQHQFGSVNHQNQFHYQQQHQPHQPSSFSHNNDYHQNRERRDAHYRVQMNDWQTQPDGPKPNSLHGFRDGYCTSPECMAKVASNNIRNENNNGPLSNKIPNVHPNPYSPNSGNNNKIQLPAVQLTPPQPQPYLFQEDGQEEQNRRNVEEFYGNQYGYHPVAVEAPNYPNIVNNVPAPSTEENGQFGKDLTSNTSTEPSIISIRASSIAIGDNFEIVRIEVDISEGDDNEETNLEVEDQ